MFWKYIFAIVLWLPGLIGNLFILVSISIQTQAEGSLQPVNILLACNCLTNLGTGLLTVVVLTVMLHVCPHKGFISWLFFVFELLSGLQMWITTLICVFYCLKIVRGRGNCFLALKRNFSLVAAAILLVGFTLSLGISYVDLQREVPVNETQKIPNNTCPHTEIPNKLMPAKTSMTALMHVGVFALMMLSCGILIGHLCSHMRKMRGNRSQAGGANQEGLARVTLMIALLAVEFLCCTIIRHTYYILSLDRLTKNLIRNNSLVTLALCSLVPISLIRGIKTLRQRAVTCLPCT